MKFYFQCVTGNSLRLIQITYLEAELQHYRWRPSNRKYTACRKNSQSIQKSRQIFRDRTPQFWLYILAGFPTNSDKYVSGLATAILNCLLPVIRVSFIQLHVCKEICLAAWVDWLLCTQAEIHELLYPLPVILLPSIILENLDIASGISILSHLKATP